MKYLIDTNICIHFFRGKFNLLTKFEEIGISTCAVSEITIAELVYGAEKSDQPAKNYKLVEAFVEKVVILPIYDAIYKYGKEKARLRKSGIIVSDFDLLIGCTAISNDLILVTENVSDFQRLENIQIENWVIRN